MKTTIKITVFALIALFFAATAVSGQDKPDGSKTERQMMNKDQQTVQMLCSCSKIMSDEQNLKGMTTLEKERNNREKTTETIIYECVASNKSNADVDYFRDSIDANIIP